MGRQTLNTGEVGISGTGDTINAGGAKLEHNFKEVYSVFGDRRLEGVLKEGTTDDETWIRPYGTGYYQIPSSDELESPLEIGLRYEINSQDYTDTTLAIHLPEIIETYVGKPVDGSYARRGETIEISDSMGSWGQFPLVLIPSSGQLIEGQSSIMVDRPGNQMRLCVMLINGTLQWKIRFDPLYGSVGSSLLEETITIPSNTPITFEVAKASSFKLIKFMIYVNEYSASDLQNVNWSASELLLMSTGDSVITTRFSVVESDDLVTINPYVDNGMIMMEVVPRETTNFMTFTIKTVQTVETRDPIRIPVYRRTNMRWGSGGYVKNTNELNWSTRNESSNALSVDWNTRYIFKQLEFKYKSGGEVSKQTEIDWNTRDEAQEQTQLVWNIE